MIYINEYNRHAAQWLRVLSHEGLITRAFIDDRSICDVDGRDLAEYAQCHFFGGIGGWVEAFRLAGIPPDAPCWSGSAPCQPYSQANPNAKGNADERNLAPEMLRLIAERRPVYWFGEQVEKAIKWGWLDTVSADLEKLGYAVGFVVLPACAVGAPHQRSRLYVAAVDRLAISDGRVAKLAQCRKHGQAYGAATLDGSHQLIAGEPGRAVYAIPEWLADGERNRREGGLSRWPDAKGQMVDRPVRRRRAAYPAAPDNSHWHAVEWVYCRDGKYRPVEPGARVLADGVPGRVAALRGFGNAIVPQLAAEFIGAFMDTCENI